MDREEVPFLQPPLGGFGHAQKFEQPSDFSLFRKHVHNTRGIKGSCRTQVLRSSADWSSNIETEVCHFSWHRMARGQNLINTVSLCSTRFKMPISKVFVTLSILYTLKTSFSVSISISLKI